MKLPLTCCSALYSDHLTEMDGDIRGRSIYFGAVTEPLPEIDTPEYDFRSCRLLAWAVADMKPKIEEALSRYGRSRIAVVLGASNTGVDEAETYFDGALADDGVCHFPEEFRFSMLELGTPSEYLAKAAGVDGPCYTISTACSSSAKVFPAARRLIEAGLCDAAIVGGVDGRCRFAMNGFHALGALAQGRCRPLAEDRDGICLGEGVALFMMERDCAAECVGGRSVLFSGAGETSDAYHATAPDPEGCGAEAAMRRALRDAGLAVGDIDYVNLHGTGTLANDSMEMKAVRRVFGDVPCGGSSHSPIVESTKAMTGHCLGAAGAVEAAICWRKIRSGEIRRALSNSFAFGGSNASILLENA